MTELTRRSILTSLGTLGLGAAALNTAYQPAANAAVAPDLYKITWRHVGRTGL